MDVSLKVSTDELRRISNIVSNDINVIDSNFKEIYSIIDNSISHWEGAAADKARELFNKKKDNVNDIIDRLKEHPKDLMTMAGIYDVAESESVAASNALNTNVIV